MEKNSEKRQTEVYAFKVYTEGGFCAGGAVFNLRAGWKNTTFGKKLSGKHVSDSFY